MAEEVEKTAHIYGLADPRTDEVRYIGKAVDVGRRFKAHLREKRYQTTPLYCWINKLRQEGLSPGIFIFETVPLSEWEQAERTWITALRECEGSRPLNVQNGGNQPTPTAAKRGTISPNAGAKGRERLAELRKDPKWKRFHTLKRLIGQALAKGEVMESTKVKMRAAYKRHPDLLACWSRV